MWIYIYIYTYFDTGSLWESTVDLKVVLGCIQLTCPEMLHGHTKDLSRYRCQVWQRGWHRRSKGGGSGWRWIDWEASCSVVAILIIGVQMVWILHQESNDQNCCFRCYENTGGMSPLRLIANSLVSCSSALTTPHFCLSLLAVCSADFQELTEIVDFLKAPERFVKVFWLECWVQFCFENLVWQQMNDIQCSSWPDKETHDMFERFWTSLTFDSWTLWRA